MDEVIFEEFKGTGNSEIILDRALTRRSRGVVMCGMSAPSNTRRKLMRQMLIAAGCLMAVMPLAAIIASAARSQAKVGDPRFPQLRLEQLDDQQRPLGEKILKISSVGLGGPYNPMLRSPVYAERMYELLDYLRWRTSVPTKLNEMAILIVARQWRSQVEWFAHAPLAKKAGLGDSIIADLKANKRPGGMSPEEEIVYDFVTDLTTKHAVSDEVFDRAKNLLGEQQVVDLTGVAGAYVGVAMILAMAEEGVPAGREPPFKDGER
jgi:4-carboxymuconolactone decarboxylase